jgi:hypothetical protein
MGLGFASRWPVIFRLAIFVESAQVSGPGVSDAGGSSDISRRFQAGASRPVGARGLARIQAHCDKRSRTACRSRRISRPEAPYRRGRDGIRASTRRRSACRERQRDGVNNPIPVAAHAARHLSHECCTWRSQTLMAGAGLAARAHDQTYARARDSSCRLNSRTVAGILRSPANAVGMKKFCAVIRGCGTGAALEAFSHPPRTGCRDWHISRCRGACLLCK